MPRKQTVDFPRPMATADTALFTVEDGVLKILLIKRARDPFAGKWALPGGFVEIDEEIQAAASREMLEETGVSGVHLSFLGLYARPGRDPRGRTMTAAFTGAVPFGSVHPVSGDDAAAAQWYRALKPPPLAFDHADMLRHAIERLRAETVMSDAAFRFLGPRFTEGELRAVFEAVLGRKIPVDLFLDRMDRTGVLKPAPGGHVRLCRKTLARLSREMGMFRF